MKKYLMIMIAVLVASCSNGDKKSDAYGNFEADETVISAEAAGKLLKFDIEEGDHLKSGELVAVIDTTDLVLKLKQLKAQKAAIRSRSSNVFAQIDVLEEQLKKAKSDKNRIKKLLEDSAATEQQHDDIASRIDVLQKQIEATRTQNSSIVNEVEALESQIEQLRLQIDKCSVENPLKGIVLNTYAEQYELTAPGRSLYKIADMDSLILRVYVSGSQLPEIKTGSKAQVLIDKNKDSYTELEGRITWIASDAEFTPKIIQTKEERVNLVYAVKIKVKNDGSLKIGMPGEANF